MAGIHINNAASIMTKLTTIFQGDLDERNINLRAASKEISKVVNVFLDEQKTLMAMTQAEVDADFEIGGRQLDSDQARVFLAMNTANGSKVRMRLSIPSTSTIIRCWVKWPTTSSRLS